MTGIRFIHAADLHLGSKFTNTKNLPEELLNNLLSSGYRAFNKLVNDAINKQVDFVVLSGDIYDSELRNLKSQVIFKREMERLNVANIPVFIVYGNHDFVSGERHGVKLPDNVYVFPKDVTNHQINILGTVVNLTGFSYNKRHFDEKMIHFYKKDASAKYNIGLLHGNLGGKSEHGNYAPFTLSDLIEKGFAYWALGHIHKREVILEEPLAIYSGSLVGRNRKETGEKGYYLVTLDEEVTAEFIPCTDIVWKAETIKFNGDIELDAVIVVVHEKLEAYKLSNCGVLLSLTLDLSACTDFDIRKLDEAEIISAIQDDNDSFDTEFIWIIKLDFVVPTDLGEGIRFFYELESISREMTREEILTILSDLAMHSKAKKFLGKLNEDDLNALLQEALFEIKKRW